MVQSLRPSRLTGKKFRFTWTAGPTAGATHEHVFHTDGTVAYAQIEPDRPPQYSMTRQYGAYQLSHDIYLMSYLSSTIPWEIRMQLPLPDLPQRFIASHPGEADYRVRGGGAAPPAARFVLVQTPGEARLRT